MPTIILKANAEYTEITNRLKTEKDKLQSILHRLSEIYNEINILNLKSADPRQDKTVLELKATAYLNDEKYEPASVDSDKTYADFINERSLLIEAERLERKVIDSILVELSKAKGIIARPLYVDIIKRQIKALVTLSNIQDEESQLRNSFKNENLSFNAGIGCPANFLFALGKHNQSNSRLNIYIEEVLRAGYTTRAEIQDLLV
jgi:hypothetical protein